MKNLIIRALSGSVYVALIVVSILFGSSWGFPLLCCIFAFLGIIEFQKMTQSNFYASPLTLFVDLLIGLCLIISTTFLLTGLEIAALIAFVAVFILSLVRAVMQLYSHQPDSVRRIANSVLSIAYVALPITIAVYTYFSFGRAVMLLMFIMIWLNDTGAFLVGSTIGSHRLFPRLSPKKSWEGFFGGLLFCVLAGFFAKYIPWFSNELPDVSPNLLAIFGVVVSLMSTWGDLFESMVKRNVGVKDSGNIIPGHGGILDRIDSFLFVAPATYIFFFIVIILMSTTIIAGAPY